MCGRYTLKEDAADIKAWFDATVRGFENFTPNYNVAPSHTMPVIGENKSHERTIQPFRWGLLPYWAKEKKVGYSMINARAESVDSKKSFSKSFERYRCLVPTSGFYE